jgi:hypothetical protein
MEDQNELFSFEEFFKKAHYHSDLLFAGYQSKPALLRDFERKFVKLKPLYCRIFKIMEENGIQLISDASSRRQT